MATNCVACGKENLDKDTIGINKKLLGLDISKYEYVSFNDFFYNINDIL